MRWLILGLIACSPEADLCAVGGSPNDLAGFFDHLDTLPGPIDAPCIVRSFERPLSLVATDNPFSAQPAEGPRNPRIFLISGDLTVSFVPAGYGATVIEMSERVAPGRSRKGELALPVVASNAPVEAFERTRDQEERSLCGSCHPGEAPHPDGGWSSAALSPERSAEVSVATLREHAATCLSSEERCDLLTTLFEGEVVQGSFPADYLPLSER